MNEAIGNPKLESGVNQPMRVLCSGKPFMYFDGKAKILDCNEELLKITNFSKAELLGSDLHFSDKNGQFIHAITKAETDGISIFRGNVILGPDSSQFTLETVFFSLESSNGMEKGIICYVLDIKKHSMASGAEAILNTRVVSGLPEIMNASVSIHALDGSIIYVTPSVELMIGYTSDELKALSPVFAVHPDDIPVVFNVLEQLNKGGDFMKSRYRMIHKNGSVIEVETSSYLIAQNTGTGKHIVNVSWDIGINDKVKRALELSEQKYYRLVMNLPTGVSLISTEGKLLEANDAMKRIMGLPLDTPMPDLNFFTHEFAQHAEMISQLRTCINTKEVFSGEVFLKSPRSGRDIFLVYSFLPVLNHAGEVESIIGHVSDLSVQKKAESESRERAEFLNLVINAIKSPFFVKDEDHKWVILNDAAVDMMGHSREELLGKSDYDLYPGEQANVFWKFDELVFKKGSSINEEQITWSDGTIHTIVTHKQLYIEKPSGRKFIVGTIHDISSYKKIEDDLRASEKKYRELFDNANDFIITIDLEGNITNANMTLLTYLKTDLEKITRLNVFDFVNKDNLEYSLAIKDKLLHGLQENSFEFNALTLDGREITYEVKASLILRNGEVKEIQCLFSDVTARMEARQKLEKYNTNLVELNKTKDKFFSIIAHDLRNPYSSMIGFSELLLEDLETLSKNEIRDSLKIIRNSAKNSLNLLENLLAWSRLETGRMPLDPVKVVLTNIVDEVVNVLFSLAYRKKIEINNMIELNVLLYADKNMLNTILNNLVMNAIKFTPIGGEINIYATPYSNLEGKEADFTKISIADTGIGIEADICSKLFTSNNPVSSLGTEKEQGTGLGLVLSREMVEKNGGRIWVESTPGKGSVFSFTLPAYKPELHNP